MNAAELGAYVRAVRKDIGLTQKELACISGVGLSFIHDLEHGKKSVQFDSVMKVVNRLGCGISVEQRGVKNNAS
jgi:y4mF family transcriptional regulator